ncbi:PHA/PHB synthase family protein [Pseudooceanicola nanhaiensis]|uniref:PHA/PHB synthase family protein n=1 Tax=Pseudooceanicola nanhaiensis TaxID=375761 RepID=UPI001CD69695|nr:alpha/beta fold hydrolase [Pseudooceanicola nanhaiensis]MCA0921492.1 alpha/beta fold hydrolase [Pseudooceanicola nanhaiensis]
MSDTSTRPRSSDTLPAKAPGLPVPVAPQPAESAHRDLDRTLRAIMAHYTAGTSPHATATAWSDWALHLMRAPGRQLELVERAAQNAADVWSLALLGTPEDGTLPFKPKSYDHRFTNAGWQKMPFLLWEQGFLATADFWEEATKELRGAHKHNTDRVAFMLRQMLDMASPSNFPWLNPEILEAIRETRGKNLTDGFRHFLNDTSHALSHTPPEPVEGFEVGENIACTPGEVIFRNELFELIQYAPQTDKVRAEPVLIVPAWIMKYYILDLSPQNSLINYLVGQGHTVFAISWTNPGPEMANYGLEDYRKTGIMTALDEVSRVLPGQKVHACGYCLGGTLLSIAAATMARDGDDRLASITLLAAQTDFTEAGELLLFLDESQVAFLEDMMWDQGYLAQPQMAGAFAAIRAEDLIWTHAVRRYLMGLEERATDMTVWNGDTTRMPARMHSEYLRGLFLENRLSAGRFAVEGRVIALKDITAPMFVVGTETDHIAPWHSVYKVKLFTENDLRFVLTKGGHNGGIVSEPGHRKRHYRIGHRKVGARYQGPDDWLKLHEQKEGSWWEEWAAWLDQHSGEEIAPPKMGRSLAKAPGTYIFQK